MIHFWHPWRYFISECYNNGIIPLWDPYTQMGYPVHGDLQGPAYNPEAIVSSFLFPVSVYFLNYLFLGYLILGAFGFYKLSRLFAALVGRNSEEVKSTPLLAAAIIYSLGGYNTGYGHYLYITISVCLVPWMYYYFLKIINAPGYRDGTKLAVFIFLQATAGNPSFLIVSGYFFAGILFYHFFTWIKNRQLIHMRKVTGVLLCAFLLVLAMVSPVIINAYYVFGETTRGNGISLEWAAEERFALRNFLSFFTPLVSFEREWQAGANQPIFDYYIGTTTLFFAAIGFIKYRSKWIYVFTVIAVISFLLSIGLRTPLYGWFHRFLPGFNVFRMPRLIFLYDIMYFLLLAVLGIHYFLSHKINVKWFTLFVFSSVLICFLSVVYFHYFYREAGHYSVDRSSIRHYIWSATQNEKALLSAILSCAFLLMSLVAYYFSKYRLVIFILMADIIISCNVGGIARNFSDTNAAVTQACIEGAPRKFSPPENLKAKNVKPLTAFFNEWWLNTSIFIKQPCYMNDNNFELTNYMKLYNNNSTELNYFLKQPLAFLADSLVTGIKDENTLPDMKLALVSDSVRALYKQTDFKTDPSDSIQITGFKPQQFSFINRAKKESAFILQQNFTKLWHIYVDGTEVKPCITYYSFPFVYLPAGEHQVEFKYQLPHYRLFFLCSMICFVFAVIYIIWLYPFRWPLLAGFSAIIVFCSFKFVAGKNRLDYDNLKTLQAGMNKGASSSLQVANTRDSHYKEINAGVHPYNFTYPEDVAAFIYEVERKRPSEIDMLSYQSYFPAELNAYLRAIYGDRLDKQNNEDGFTANYKPSPHKKWIIYEKSFDLSNNPVEIKKEKEFGPTFVFKPAETGAGKYDMIMALADVECSFADFKGFWLSIENKGKNKKSMAYNFIHHPGKTSQQMALYFRLPETTLPDDEIKLFFWNDDERPLRLKDFKMKIISAKAFD